MGMTISTSLLEGRIEDKFTQASNAGFQHIDINTLDITTSELTCRQIAAAAKAKGLSIEKLQAFYDLEGWVGASREQKFHQFKATAKRANALGAKQILLGSQSQPQANSDHERLVEDLYAGAKIADEYDLQIAYLALPWAQHINDSLRAYELIEVVNHKALGIALNSYFTLADGSKPARFRDIQGHKIFSVQLADAPITQMDISRLKHEFAKLPGLGELSLAHFIKVIAKSGYQGHWSLARMSNTQNLGSTRAEDGFRALANLLDHAQENLGEIKLTDSELPKRDTAKGIEYLEFAVNPTSAKELRKLLSTLCFRCERKHKHKPVELWRQGAINIVINTASQGFAYDYFQENGAGVCDMGLRVGDAQNTIARARALNVNTFSQQLGEGDIDIPAIKGVGGSVLRFIDERSNLHYVWDVEFDMIAQNKIPPPSGLRRIDHLAQSMQTEKLDTWLLFYLSVFNMSKTKLVDITDPSGIVYSRAVESPEGEVRLNLNGASSHRTFSGAFLSERQNAGVQHIAFSTDDIFETSKHLKDAEFPRLEIPENYYRELAEVYDLDNEIIKSMQADNILYSRNDTGEYFQIYSQSIWNGFFVEIVERRGGYQGYGARNAPIRLSAQQRASHSQ